MWQGEVWTSDEEGASSEGSDSEDSDSETSSQTNAQQSSSRGGEASEPGSSGGRVTRSAAGSSSRKRSRPEQPSHPASRGSTRPRLPESAKRGRGRPPKSESRAPEERPKAAQRKVRWSFYATWQMLYWPVQMPTTVEADTEDIYLVCTKVVAIMNAFRCLFRGNPADA